MIKFAYLASFTGFALWALATVAGFAHVVPSVGAIIAVGGLSIGIGGFLSRLFWH